MFPAQGRERVSPLLPLCDLIRGQKRRSLRKLPLGGASRFRIKGKIERVSRAEICYHVQHESRGNPSEIARANREESKMRRTVLCLLALAVLASAVVMQAADFWEKKHFTEWSLKECRKLLQKSPWAKRRTFSQVFIEPLQNSPVSTAGQDPITGASGTGSRSSTGARSREQNPRLTYSVQFRSALPIRQAIVRSAMLQNKYDDLNDEQKQAFDAKVEPFLAASYPDSVVVYVSFSSNVREDFLELSRHWQNQTASTLSNFVYLIGGKKRKVPPLEYAFVQQGGNTFRFVFPREVDGEPLVAPKDKSLQLEFIHPNIRNQGEKRVLLSFKVKDLLVDGVPVY